MNKTIYLTPEENQWLKLQEPGFIRWAVRRYMVAFPDKKVPMPKEAKHD